jgi:hypothetical protein
MKRSLSAYKNKTYPAVKHQQHPIQDFLFSGPGQIGSCLLCRLILME